MNLIRPDLSDLLILLGVGCAGAGLWMVYPPAALVAVGIFLTALGVAGARRG